MTYRTSDDAIAVSGRFIDFDGTIITVLTDEGLVSLRADGLLCDGACPDLSTFVPELRLIGPKRVGAILVPALVDAYARDVGWKAETAAERVSLSDGDGVERLRFQVTLAGPDESIDRFVAHDANALLSMRELRPRELEAARVAGLGRLDVARQARILALDALVPVASPRAGITEISIEDLAQGVSEAGNDFELHLEREGDGQIEGFEDRILIPFGARLASADVEHDSREALIGAVSDGENAISLLPFGQTGRTQPLRLTGPCGLRSEARFLTLKTEDYPLTFPIFLYLPQRNVHPRVEAFLDWLRSPSAQLVIRRAGFVDLASVPMPLAGQGDRLANAILSAGPEVPLGELQRMIRVLQPRVRMSSTFRFEVGSTRLDGQSRSNVMQLAQALRDGQFRGRELLFVGFSDGRGPAEANRDLSSARAEAVLREVERALGGRLPFNVTLDTEAFGEALPLACDDTIWGQQTNRRVELWVRDLE